MVMVIGPALTGFWAQGLYYLPPPPIHFLYQFPWTISWLGSPGITTYGMVFGLQQTARVLVTVSTSMLILISTDVGDFTWAFERFRAPPQVGFALTAALRFLPEHDLPDHAGAAGRRTARLRHVPAALVPGQQVAGLRPAAGPLRGADHGAAAGRQPARHRRPWPWSPTRADSAPTASAARCACTSTTAVDIGGLRDPRRPRRRRASSSTTSTSVPARTDERPATSHRGRPD